MDLGLGNRQALVLGASRGLGAAVARVLAFEGALVIAAARSVESIQLWRSELPAGIAARVHPVAVDLNSRPQIDELAEHARRLGPAVGRRRGRPRA
jgi:3-oxoacyl-[acyl-carrier protein] reductase